MKNLNLMSLLVLSAFWLLAGQAVASPRQQAPALTTGSVNAPDADFDRALARDRVSLDQAAAMVRRQTGGRIIKASSRSSNGRTVHFIRVLTPDGKVFTVRVDAASGRVL